MKRFTDAALLAPLLLLFVLQMLPPRSMCGFPIGYVHSRRHVGPALVVLCVIGGPLALSLPRQLRVVATVVIAIALLVPHQDVSSRAALRWQLALVFLAARTRRLTRCGAPASLCARFQSYVGGHKHGQQLYPGRRVPSWPKSGPAY